MRPFYIYKKWGHANGFMQIYNLQSLSEMTTVKKIKFHPANWKDFWCPWKMKWFLLWSINLGTVRTPIIMTHSWILTINEGTIFQNKNPWKQRNGLEKWLITVNIIFKLSVCTLLCPGARLLACKSALEKTQLSDVLITDNLFW